MYNKHTTVFLAKKSKAQQGALGHLVYSEHTVNLGHKEQVTRLNGPEFVGEKKNLFRVMLE